MEKKPYGYAWNCNFGEALTLRERSLGTKLFLVRIRENTDYRKLCIQILFTMCYPCLSQIWDNFILNPKIKLLDVRPNLCLNFYFYIIGWKFTLHFLFNCVSLKLHWRFGEMSKGYWLRNSTIIESLPRMSSTNYSKDLLNSRKFPSKFSIWI